MELRGRKGGGNKAKGPEKKVIRSVCAAMEARGETKTSRM